MLGLFKQLRLRAGFVSEQNVRKSAERIEQALLPTSAAPFVQTHPQALLREGREPPRRSELLFCFPLPDLFSSARSVSFIK